MPELAAGVKCLITNMYLLIQSMAICTRMLTYIVVVAVGIRKNRVKNYNKLESVGTPQNLD